MNEAQCARTMQIIDTHGRDPAALIAILQDVQAENSYLSQENLELIAKELNVAISAVFFRSAEPPDKMDLKFILRLWAQNSARLCAVQTLESERKF